MFPPRGSLTARPLLPLLGLFAALAAPARAADRVHDAVVPVVVSNTLGKHHGSGFCIGDGSWVVTCYHVLNYALAPGKEYLPHAATVILPWTGEAETARVVATDAPGDLVLLRVERGGLPAIPLAPRATVTKLYEDAAKTDRRFAISGYPPPTRLPEADEPVVPKRNEGTVMMVGQVEGVPMFVLHPLPEAGQGWSGGPLYLSESGTVVGIFHALIARKSAPDQFFPRAISVERLYDLLEKAGVKDFAPFLNPPAPTPRPDDAEELFRREVRGTLAALSGRWSVAEEERRAQIKRRPGSARARAGLASALFGQGKREEAFAAFAESARLDPRRARTYYVWATALEQSDQLKEADERFRRAAELEPGDPEILIGYAGLLQKQQRTEEANVLIARAYESAPTHPLARGLHGAALVDSSKKDEGIALLRDAVTMAHGTLFARTLRTSLVDALKKAGRWDDAEKELRDTLASNDEDPAAHYSLATFLSERGKREDARRHAQRCLDLKPAPTLEAAARTLLDRLAP